MNFTELFIRRPVLSIVVSLLILVVGIRSLLLLQVREYPRTINAAVTINTTYYGADPDVVAGFITSPLELAISQAEGIDYLTSSSKTSTSTITAFLRLNYDPNKALSEINTKVNSVLNQLPPNTKQPVLRVSIGQSLSPLMIGFWADEMPINKINDYLSRIVLPRLQGVPGVQSAGFLYGKNLALRAWIDPVKLAAYGLTAADVSQAMTGNNYVSGLGSTMGHMVQMNLSASTSLSSVDDFKEIAIKQVNGATIRLKDVADVKMGADDYDAQLLVDGKNAMWIAVEPAPTANLLEVVKGAREVLPDIFAQLPPGMHGEIINDSSRFVEAATHEVILSLLESLIIVTLVVFIFLGSMRSVAIPVIAIPLSLIGAFTFMLVCGFTINLLTLLAFILAIGLVVDDAIIVVENVNRHLEEGMAPLEASIKAARELGSAIVAMSAVLIAVYVPIGFQGGLTGALFTEFAFTLVGAVVISTIIALTLSPMMCSRMLRPHSEITGWQGRVTHFTDRQMDRLMAAYHRVLHASLSSASVTLCFAMIVLGSIYFLYTTSRSELAPQEDKGAVMSVITTSPTATLEQRRLYIDNMIGRVLALSPDIFHAYSSVTLQVMNLGIGLKPWDERTATANEMQQKLQAIINSTAGVRGAAMQPPPLPGVTGAGPSNSPIQFVIGSTDGFERMADVGNHFVDEARKSGLFAYLDHDLKIDQPRATLQIDRAKAAQMGLSMTDVGGALTSMLGGGYINYFVLQGRSYKVIPQVEQVSRLNPDQILSYYIRTPNGGSVPLSTVASIETKAVPQSFNHFQQLNAVTVAGTMSPGVPLGEALKHLQTLAATTLPQGYAVDYAGQSRQYMQESSGFALTFAFSLIIIFLALAALFESFRDPLIILVSVPMSIAGALLFINLGVGGVTINIYTQVGLVTLMGLISKHGILIVRFANQLQMEGHSKRKAIELATEIRLRPILMTTGAMVLGVVPLLISSGAGAVSRFHMGLVIASGISIGTLFTLFVVPAVYLLLAADHSKDNVIAASASPAPAE